MLEGGSIKNKLQKIFRRAQTAWKKFPKPVVNMSAPFIGMLLGAKTKNQKVGQATTNISKRLSGGKNLKLTDVLVMGLD